MRRILHPLPEILFLAVSSTITDCDDYEDIAAWGTAILTSSAAANLVGAANDNRSIKSRRKLAAWSLQYLQDLSSSHSQ